MVANLLNADTVETLCFGVSVLMQDIAYTHRLSWPGQILTISFEFPHESLAEGGH